MATIFAKKQRRFSKQAVDNQTIRPSDTTFIQEIVKQDNRCTKLYIVRALLHKQTAPKQQKKEFWTMLEPEIFKKTKN